MYSTYRPAARQKRSKLPFILGFVALVIVALIGYKIFGPTPSEKAVARLQFDPSVALAEQETISQAITEQQKTLNSDANVKVSTALVSDDANKVLSAYVPITNLYSTKQKITAAELVGQEVLIKDADETTKAAVAQALSLSADKLGNLQTGIEEISRQQIVFVPAGDLNHKVKLLGLDGNYYLDSFTKGAVFRSVVFEGNDISGLDGLKLNELSGKDQVFKVNMSGVTALTRGMLKALNSGTSPTFYSEVIGPFLADADLTHVSNEVSFKENCTYSTAIFCSPPEFIETLKASGVDLVELTGNHNNDTGAQFNTDTINLYRSLGWNTVGGGLNTEDAAKPYLADQKGSKVTFLAYNFPDSPNGGAIAGASKAGANSFELDRIKTEIETAKQNSQFVIVNIQFWECYAYPDGYLEYPICDQPIANQAETFKKMIDLGADMVVGSSAHQPQTYELYNGKPIYYGLGNMYFEQTQWPGTERGIILTHYFNGGKLLQTKLTPTVYEDDFQTRIMTDKETEYLLKRLDTAR